MMLIDTRGWEPEPDPDAEPEDEHRRSLPHLPWRPFAWIAAFAWLLVIAAAVDGFAGYGVFLVAIALGSWRLERSAAHWGVGRPGDSGAWY
jgi:hypothetical protein